MDVAPSLDGWLGFRCVTNCHHAESTERQSVAETIGCVRPPKWPSLLFARPMQHHVTVMSMQVVGGVMWRWSNEQAQQRKPTALKVHTHAHTRHGAVSQLQTQEPQLYHSVIFSALSQSERSEEGGNDVRGHS